MNDCDINIAGEGLIPSRFIALRCYGVDNLIPFFFIFFNMSRPAHALPSTILSFLLSNKEKNKLKKYFPLTTAPHSCSVLVTFTRGRFKSRNLTVVRVISTGLTVSA